MRFCWVVRKAVWTPPPAQSDTSSYAKKRKPSTSTIYPQEDLNVTLTAISQLWNAADFLARLPTYKTGSEGQQGGPRSSSGVDSSKYVELLEVLFNALQVRCLHHAAFWAEACLQSSRSNTDEQVSISTCETIQMLSRPATGVFGLDDLNKTSHLTWKMGSHLFHHLAAQHLSTDGRPEVRNSGVRTLFSVVVSHGGALSPEQWRHCWWSMLFPLLRTVHHMSTTSSQEEVCLHCQPISPPAIVVASCLDVEPGLQLGRSILRSKLGCSLSAQSKSACT